MKDLSSRIGNYSGICGLIMIGTHALGVLTGWFQTPLWYQFVMIGLIAAHQVIDYFVPKKEKPCPRCGQSLVSRKPQAPISDTRTVG